MWNDSDKLSVMAADLPAIFETLKTVLVKYEKRLAVKSDTPTEYTLITKSPSPFPQHKGQPMFFGSVRSGKAYVSFHLMPLYMSERLTSMVSPALRKRMQGKTCFNFKALPEPELLAELKTLTQACVVEWKDRKWL